MDTMKYKDQVPEKTVEQIIEILKNQDIQTHLEWFPKGPFDCLSNRVTIDGTTIGANGKGIGEAYAKASAYAELLERLQNDMTYLGKHDTTVLKHRGVWYAYDEIIQGMDKLTFEDNAFYNMFFSRQECHDVLSKLIVLKQWDFKMSGRENEYVCVPFVSIKNQKIEYLPIGFCQLIYASNGMCAGNTMEEALVQGISEIFERYACKTLIYEKITPPDIPDEYLSRYKYLFDNIQKIRSEGHYKVIVKDCSLSKGYPVTAVIIINQSKGTFGVKFAAHPVFSIALERSLTEALQGKSLAEFSSLNRIGTYSQIMHRDNILNIFKTGTGYYPAELFSHKYDYAFTASAESRDTNNKDMLKRLLQIILDDGWDIMIRDVSYLGFPSYYVIVPGMSEMFVVDHLKAKEQHTLLYISEMLNHLPDVSAEDLELLSNMILLKYNSVIENQIGVLLGRPFKNALPGGEYATQFLLFVCLYQLGRQKEAYDIIKVLKHAFQNTEQSPYFNAISSLLKFSINGLDEYLCLSLLIELYGQSMGERVFYQFIPRENTLRNLYPKFNCWNCDSCEGADICCYPETAKLYKKLREKALEAKVSQEHLLCQIKELGIAGGI